MRARDFSIPCFLKPEKFPGPTEPVSTHVLIALELEYKSASTPIEVPPQ